MRRAIRIQANSPRYPDQIHRVLQTNAPKHIDLLGNPEILDTVGVGVSGARKSSQAGLESARYFAERAARQNITIISGNALGVDFAAHYSCLHAGGKTVLVIPEGLNQFKIRNGMKTVWDWNRVLVISPFGFNEVWRPFRAIARNRLIIALSRVILVVEAKGRGGTFQTGKEALQSGIPLFVAQYENIPRDLAGNQILLSKGALGLRLEEKSEINFASVLRQPRKPKVPFSDVQSRTELDLVFSLPPE